MALSHLPINDLENLCSIDGIPLSDCHNSRPYAWSNSVSSIDGILSFAEHTSSISDVALGYIDPNAAATDFRVLCTGWAHADAILLSARNIRTEPNVTAHIPFHDLLEFRRQKLAKRSVQPDLIILTTTGELPQDHPIWLAALGDRSVYVACPHAVVDVVRSHTGETANVLGMPTDETGGVDLTELMKYLRTSLDIHYIDISCGGSVIDRMRTLKLLDESRITLAGHVMGHYNSNGERRPTLFPDDKGHASWTMSDAPILRWRSVKTYGEHLVFLRGVYTYRHGNRGPITPKT